jgi:branched-chain amino acid transport system substrate-binding protein
MLNSATYQTEAHIFSKHILATKPDAKIGLLYQNDGYGKEYLTGVRDTLGSAHAGMIIKEVSYEVVDPTVDSQVASLQGAGVDTLIIAATPKAAAQAIRKTYDMGWTPLRYLSFPANSLATSLKPAGVEKAKGLISSNPCKDPSDPRWKDDPGYKEWEAFMTNSMTPADLTDVNAVVGLGGARMLVQVLKQCGADLSRENIMRQAANLRDFEWPMLLPGIKINTSPENYFPFRQTHLIRFNGANWELLGDVMTD